VNDGGCVLEFTWGFLRVPAITGTGLSLEGEKVCTNCKTTETCLWRDVECGNSFIRLCNACGLYFRCVIAVLIPGDDPFSSDITIADGLVSCRTFSFA
jgi:hypothetical protein